MSYRLSPEFIKSVGRIDVVRQEVARTVAEIDDDSALAATLEKGVLSEEQIVNIQKSYFNAVGPLVQSDALFNVAQQQADLQEDLIELADTLDGIQRIRVRTLRPLFETESVKNAIEDPAGTVEEYREPEAVPKPGEVMLSADQEGVRMAWGASVLAADRALKAGRDQIDETRYTDAQLKAAVMILAVALFFGAFGAAVAAPAALTEALAGHDTFVEAWEDTVNKAEDTAKESESDNNY